MRGMIAVVWAVLLVLAGCGSPAPAAPTIDGDWQGQIEAPGAPLRIGVTFAGDGGTFDLPAQGIADLPLRDLVVDGPAVSFALPDIPGGAAFAGTRDADTIAGDYTQGGATSPFTLTRGTLPPPARPQEPQPPFPYAGEEVTLDSGGTALAGTVTLPDGPGTHPAVALISGSGPQDRDGTIFGHKPFLLLADTLTRAGFAVLRVDDRGTGGSGGSLLDAGYDDLSGDALAAVGFLRGRAEIDPARVGLFGHSEGGYLAPLAAQRAPADVAFVVSMAGPAVPGDELLVEQNRLLLGQAGVPAAEIDAQVAFLREFVGLLRAGDRDAAAAAARERITAQVATLPESQRPSAEQVDAQVTATLALEPFVLHDPAPSLRALSVPVLAFFAERDLQVPPAQNEPALRELLADHPDATIRTLPGLNHLMQPSATGSVGEYGAIETTLAPEVLELVTTWMSERFR